MTSIIPTYNVQIDSRYRDVQNYPNPTDFAVSFKAPSSTGTYVQGVPINAGTGTNGNGFNTPLQIDPDFKDNEFKVINGTIQNLKAIDANNILACGLIYDTPFSALQGNTVLISSTSSFTYVPLFLIRMTKNANQWSLNWFIFINQGVDYPVQTTLNNVTRTTFQIDSQNNIFFAFDFNVPQFDLRIVTPEDITLFGSAAEGTTIYTVKNPTDGLKCMGIFSFDQSGNLNYINGHPWGYHILSSNNNIDATKINGRFNLEIDTSLSLYISGNTNPFYPKINKTVNSTGTPSFSSSSKLYNYKIPGDPTNYGIQITSPIGFTNKNILLSVYNLDLTPSLLVTRFTINDTSDTGFGPIFPFASIKGIDYTGTLVGGKRNYYFFLYPSDNVTTYNTFVIGFDILTNTYTTFINNASAYNPHTRPGWGTSITYYSDLNTVYLFDVNYGTNQIDISSWNPTTPAVLPVVLGSSAFIPWNFPVNLYNYYAGFDSIVYQYLGTKYIYYIIGALTSAGNSSNDPYAKTNPYTIIRYNPNTNTSVTVNFINYSNTTFNFFIRNSKLYLVMASTSSGIYEVDPSMTLGPTLLSNLTEGFLIAYPSPYLINGSYYIIFNLDTQGIVYNIDDMTKPYVVNQTTRYPLFDQGESGSVNGFTVVGDKAYVYGIMQDSADPSNTWFFKADWLANDVVLSSSHYNANIDGYLSIPENYIYSIDTISLNFPNIVSNTLLFNPLTNLNTKLAFWFDASVATSILLADNRVQAWFDLSGNNVNFVQPSLENQPRYANNSIIFDENINSFMNSFNAINRKVKYIIAIYKITTKNTQKLENIVGYYSSISPSATKPTIGIAATNYTNVTKDVSVYNFLVNTDNSYPSTEYTYTITNGNDLTISDFGYDYDADNVGLFFDGINFNYDMATPNSGFNVVPGNILNIGGKQTGNFATKQPGYFTGELKEIIGMNEYPDVSTRAQIQSYLAYKWNCNSYISNNNPFKQQLSSSVYNLMVTKSTELANVSIYDITNLQNIKFYEILSTTSCSPLKNWSSIAISSSGRYQTAVARNDNIYTSDTYGNSWISRSVIGSWASVSMSSSGQYQAAVSQNGLIHISNDYGVTWLTVDENRNWVSIAVNSDNVTAANDGKYQTAVVYGGRIYTSSDFGATWTARDSVRNWTSAEINGTGQYQTAVVNLGQIYRSTDFGVTWNAVESNRVWEHVDINYTGDIQSAVVNGGQIYVSTDFGATWTARDSNRAWNSISLSSSGVIQAASVYGGQIYESTDSGSTWTAKDSNRNWTHVVVNGSGTVQSASVDNSNIYLSNNSGNNWSFNSPIDIYHIVNPYDSNGGYFIIYLDTSGFYIWKCDPFLQFFNFVTEYHFNGVNYQFNCWKLIPYTKNNELFFIILFKNGYAIKFKLSSANVLTQPANATFAINKNFAAYGVTDVLSSGEIFKYDDGSIYLFVLVGSKTYTLDLFLENRLGYIYFCNITNEAQFDFNSNVTQTYSTLSSNARATSIYRYPDGAAYLILRSIGSAATYFINISDYTTFVYPYTDLVVIPSGAGAGYSPPQPWVPLELGSPGSIVYEDGLSGALISLDMYTNPINNTINSLQPECGDTTSFLLPLDDQQFYLNTFDFTNIKRGPQYKFPFYGGWTQVNLSNVKNWSGCDISFYGQYMITIETSGQIYTSSDYGTTFLPNSSIPAANWFICCISHDKATAANDGRYQLISGPGYYVYRSTDFGATFTAINNLGVKDFIGCSVSADGQYMTIAEYNGYIWRSVNGGTTWTSITTVTVNGSPVTGTKLWYITAMSNNGQYQLATAGSDYIYLSSDFGATWANPSTNAVTGIPIGSYFGASMTIDGQTILVAQVGGFLRQSSDGGVTWSRALDAGARFWFDVGISSDPATVPSGQYRTATPALGSIYKSNNGGVTYTTVADSELPWRNTAISGTGQYQLATPNNNVPYISKDYGVTWTPIGNIWNGVAMSYNSQYTSIVVTAGFIYTSSDYSMTFTRRESSRSWEKIAINQSSVTGEVGKYQSATVDGGQIYNSADFGATWTARDSNRAWRGISIGFSGQYQTAVVYGGQIYTSSNYGVTWTARDSNRNWKDVALNPVAGANDSLYQTAVVYGGQIYTSSDRGVNWTARDSNRNWNSVSISSSGAYQTAVVYGGYIYRSTDSGVNWTAVTSVGLRDWTSVSISSDGSVQTAVADNDLIYVSTDYGVNWVGSYEPKKWTDVAISANGINKLASVYKDFNYHIYSVRTTQIKHGTLGQRTYSASLLTNILNGKGGSLIYYTDVSNSEYSTEYYRRSNGSYPDPVTVVYHDISSIGIGFVNKLTNEGLSDWLTYYGGDVTNYYGLNTNISNITIDKSLAYLYTVGGWEQKIQSYYTNATGTFTQLNQIDSLNSGYNGFISKIDIIDGSVQWLTPMIGPASDYIEKVQYIATNDEIALISHFDSTILLLYDKQNSSTGPWSNPVKTILNVGNTSVETSSIVVLDTDSEYKWHSLLYTEEESRNVSLYDVAVDENNENKTLQVVGVSNSTQIECKDSSGGNVQKLYSKIDPFTQKEIFIYGFGIDGIYQHSNKIEFSPNVQVNIQDIKSFSNTNQIYIFPNYKTSALDSTIKIFNRDSSLAKTIPISNSVNPILNEVNRNCCQPISYLYNSSYIAENGLPYSRIIYQPDGTGPTGLSTQENSLTNYSLFIQGPLLSTSALYSATTKTLISEGSVLDKNFSIRGNYLDNYVDYSTTDGAVTKQRFNIILNQSIDIKLLDRNNLPYQYLSDTNRYTYTEWQGSIVKSPINDIISYDISLLPNSQNRITVTNLYGLTLNTYSSPTGSGVVPYYLYYPNSSVEGGVKYILVNSVTYSSATQTYFLTISNLDDLKVNGVYYGPYLYLSKKNLSALYTLQFYPATLRSARIYYVSINNLIIPNRPIRNTNLPGVRYLTDLPYVYLSVYNTDDVGNFDSEIVNNFFSNNVSKGFNAVFEIPMKYATVNENFVVLSTSSRPKVKFSPGFYNIRCTLTDPDGNILLLDNTPYKPGDIAFTGSTVPDMLMNCNISLEFEPTEFIIAN